MSQNAENALESLVRRGTRPLVGAKARQKHGGELVVDERKRIAHLVDVRGLRRVGARATKSLVHFRLAEKHRGDIGRRSMREHGRVGAVSVFTRYGENARFAASAFFPEPFPLLKSATSPEPATDCAVSASSQTAHARKRAGISRSCRRIHIDFGRFAQRIDSRDILRKHLGRRKIGRRLASKGADLVNDEPCISSGVDDPKSIRHTSKKPSSTCSARERRRANHHIGKRDVAMDKAAFKEIKVRKQVKHIAGRFGQPQA